MAEEKEKKEEIEKEGVDTKQEENKPKEMIPKQDYEELDDRYKRILAEFENFKKRSSKERESLYNSILSDVLEVILPVLDNLENAAKVETRRWGIQKRDRISIKTISRRISLKRSRRNKNRRRNFWSRTSWSSK